MMKISVVVPAYNEEDYLPACLTSLKKQDFKGDFEIIVVDNNSTDKTSQIAKQAGVKVVFEPKRGTGSARQAGAVASLGEIIAYTDADTIVPENWLSTIATEFEEDKNLAAFGGLYNLSSGPFLIRMGFLSSIRAFNCLDKFLSNGWNLAGTNFAVRKTCFLKTGGFNISLQINEEHDISQRIKEFGTVKLDSYFLVKTSGRGFKYGLISWILRYGPATFSRVFLKRNNFNKLKPIRKESRVSQIILEPLLIVSVVLLVFISSPSVYAKAQERIAFVHKKIDSADYQIKKESHKLKVAVASKVENLRYRQR
ncbi:MAG: glycosyltransferase family A protein [bacterium]